MTDPARRVAAEAFGTGMLVAAVVGSGIMPERLTDDMAVTLLANTLATAAMLMVLISILGPVSGAHLNPVVTGVLVLKREIDGRTAALYVAAQCIGGVIGTVCANLMFSTPALQLSTTIRTGASLWLAEAVATFGLVTVILTGRRTAGANLPWLVGLYIASAYWFTASTSFANPAVTLARSLTDSFAGIRLADAPAFMAAQFCGAFVALWFLDWLLRRPARDGA